MSTTEDVIHRTILEPQCSEPDVSEGACGGVDGLRPTTPFSDAGDNLSMEVRFSEGSSRHASDISDVSYQNLLEDKDIPGPNLSRRESEDSVDSYLPDYCDELARDQEIMDMSSQQTSTYSDKISDRISIRMTDDHIHILTDESKVDQKKISHSVKSDPGATSFKTGHGSEMKGLNKAFQLDAGTPVSIHDNFRKHELVINMREQQRSRSLPPNEETKEDVSKKRNSLEIRNNIPVYGEVKNYEKDIDNFAYNNQGAKPKIRKQSPGLACRIEDDKEPVKKENGKIPNANSVTESVVSNRPVVDSSDDNEKEMDHATKVINELIQVSKANALALNAQVRKEAKQKETPLVITNGVMNPVQMLDPDAFPIQKQADIENEYEYVKYSRIQEGNSYVGMRLAYSSSEGGEEGTVNGADQSNVSLESPQEGTPDQVSSVNLVNTSHRSGNVNEDALTEIPLNGPGENSTVIDEYKIFTLSPENTECDSVEIESVTSEGDDDKSPSGMPNVEDGLSSSQTSDVEDNNNSNEQNTPTKQLHIRQQQEIERKLYGVECDKMKPKEMDAEAIIDDLKLKREALDSAIADIKTAIQKSKGIALEAPYNADSDNVDPIWIKRDDEKVIPRGQSTHEVIHSREEFERRRNIELVSREHDKVYHSENEKDKLLENPQTEGKVYHTPKGYDSDDEFDEIDNVRYTRRIKGKKYSQIPKDDSMVHSETSQYMDVDVNLSHVRIVDSVSMYSDSNSFAYAQDSHSDRRNSESQYSSEDFCSDNEVPTKNAYAHQTRDGDFDTDEETDQLLEKQYQGNQYVDIPELTQPPVNRSAQAEKRQSKAKEGENVQINDPENPSVLIEGVLFRARYLGSTQLISEGQPSKAMRMMQAQEAVGRIKAPEGENQPSTEVDLFVSTEKIMVLNTDLQEIMMDHSLRTISYIADIGEILVIMARRRLMGSPGDTDSMRRNKQSKILCHVFETDEAQLIAQSIGQAFQVAYMEFLKANGIEDPGLMKEIDYQDVLNQQEIYGEELNLFANKEMHKEVIVPKLKGELLGVVIVESGWGSMVPTVVLANMAPTGPSARCGQLNIGDQIISVNGISLVGLPLSTCQTYIKSAKAQTVVKLTVVPCPPVVEVCIKRPDVKYQLGFSVQNGVICSLLRGGIAERGGVRVGHRIIEINNQSVVAVPHEKIVTLLANSVGEIHMKTMPTSIFRLLTGQETPHYL